MSASRDIGQSAGPKKPATGAGKAHVLVVDDSDLIRALLANILLNAGYNVVLAGNGLQALDRLREQAVQLVVTDMLMPEMDGLQLIAALRKSHPDLPIIGMSGGWVKSDECLARAVELGAAATVAKPFRRDEMLGAVAKVLHAEAR